MTSRQDESPRNKLLSMVNSRYLSQAICIATRRRIPDIINPKEAVNISEVAAKLDCHEINLYRLMSFLAANGIFFEKEGRNFIGNELSETMKEGANNAFYVIEAFGSISVWQSVAYMDLALDKDAEDSPFQRINGKPFHTYLISHPEEQQAFDHVVCHDLSAWLAEVPVVYDFSRYKTICDLAGGTGYLLKSIMDKYPDIHATLFEVVSVSKDILPELTSEPYASRFTVHPGDLWEKIEPTAEIFTISMTLHCMQDSNLSLSLEHIKEAMARTPGSRLLIFECDVDAIMKPNEMSTEYIHDIIMLCQMGGRQRRLTEWFSVINAHGFELLQKINVCTGYVGFECQLT